MKNSNFKYRSSNGLINVDTLSPSGLFYYKIKEPKELNKSAFGCEIAFFDLNDEIIYHRSNVYAHELHSKAEIDTARDQMKSGKKEEKINNNIEVVMWSKQGNVAYFLEHYSWDSKKLYESVFLNLREKKCFRIDELKNKFEIVDSLNLEDKNFNEDDVFAELRAMKLLYEAAIKDQIKSGSFFSRNKWHPDQA